MDVLPVRPPPPHRPRPAAPRGAPRSAADATHAAHATHAEHAAHRAPAAHAADAPPTPEDLALIAKQAGFDQMMQAQAEGQREANALRDLMMEQLKHDDQAMRSWIKLI